VQLRTSAFFNWASSTVVATPTTFRQRDAVAAPTAHVFAARQIAMWLIKELTTLVPWIGQRVGGRDHTTIMHGMQARSTR
jgi:hypothetical protein